MPWTNRKTIDENIPVGRVTAEVSPESAWELQPTTELRIQLQTLNQILHLVVKWLNEKGDVWKDKPQNII